MSNPSREAIAVGRFSTDKQDEGDSIRRQQNSFVRVCQRWELQPSTRWTIFDKGLSGFYGDHLSEKAELGRFLRALEAGQVQPDASGQMPVLVWEAVDRMTRLPQLLATDLVKRLVSAGVAIVFDEADLWIDSCTIKDKWIMLQVLIDQAYQYSRRLSGRVKSAWQRKRDKAATGKKFSKRRPAWLDWDDARQDFVVNDGARAVRYMFEQTAEGVSQRSLLRLLQQHYAPIGPSGRWNTSYIQKVLSDRSVLGEHQPCKFEVEEDDDGEEIQVRVPACLPVKGYYPAVVDEPLWLRAQAGKAAGVKAKGRHSQHVNLFVGLVKCGFDNLPMHVTTSRAKRQNEGEYVQRRLTSYGHISMVSGACPVSLDYYGFERAMLSFLRELDPAELDQDRRRDNRLRDAERELAGIEEYLAELQAEYADRKRAKGRVATLSKACEDEETKRDRLLSEIGKLRAELHAARPLEDTHNVLDRLASLKGEELHAARLRLRTLIAESVEAVIVWPEKYLGRVHAAVRITFPSGSVRNIAVSGDWSQWQTVLDDDDGFDRSQEAITSILSHLRQRADRIAKVQPYTAPDELPSTVGKLADEWLKLARSEKKKDSFRTIPAHIRRFVSVIGADTASVDAGGWKKWVAWLKREVKAGRMESNTARVGLNRCREFVRWMVANGRAVAFNALEASGVKTLKA